MKKYLLVFPFFLIFQLAQSQILLEDFESNPHLGWQPLDQINVIHGNFTAPTPNLVPGGSNSSANVGCYSKGISAFSTLQATSPAPFDLTSFAKFELDVLSPAAGGEVIFQLFSIAQNQEIKVKIKTPGVWETLSFDFSPFSAVANFTEIRLIFNSGTAAAGESWCVDNLKQSKGVGNPCDGVVKIPSIVEDFECQHNFKNIFYGGADISTVDNPHPTADNPSAKVGEYRDPAGAPWAGLGFEFPAAFNLSVLNQLECKIYSPTANIPLLFKLEGSGNGVEFLQVVAEKNKWVNYKINFSSAHPTQHNKLVIFVNGGINGPGATYFIDDLKWTGAVGIFTPKIEVFKISPNPVFDVLRVENLDEKIVRFEIFNALGQRVLKIKNQPEIDVNRFASGIYVLAAFDEKDVLVGNSKFVKQ